MPVRIGAAVVVGLLLIVGTPVIASAAPTPSEWCGTGESATDLPDAVTSYQVHVIYAIAVDGPDNFGSRVTPIVRDLAMGDSWWQAQDPARTPRFDLASFPGCDSAFGNLDISSVRLPGTVAEWEVLGTQEALTRARTSLANAFADTHKKYVVYLDTPVASDRCGVALSGLTQSAYAGASAVVFLQPTSTRNCLVGGLGTGAYPAMVVFHELIHTLQPSPTSVGTAAPPHLCDGNHVCDDAQDIMASGGVSPARLSAKLLDSGHDDYYAHGGPWFDVRNSSWLSHLDGATAALAVSSTSGGKVLSDLPGVSCAVCTTTWDAGSRLVVQAVPDPGYVFTGWLGGCSGTSVSCTVTMVADVSVSAHFARPGVVPVRIVGPGAVDGCARRCEQATIAGKSVTLRAEPERGARFVRWEGSCRGTKRVCSLIATQDMTVRAVFASD